MQENISQKEILYRAVKRSKPSWLDNNGKPTSAMYKDTGGISVDRDGGRDVDSVVSFMKEKTFKNRLKGVVSLTAEKCLSEPFAVEIEAAPSPENPYHANIKRNEKDERISQLQALKLADISKVEYIDDDMKWIR